VAAARSVIVAAKPYLTEDDPPEPDRTQGPHARVGRYAWVDHYAPAPRRIAGGVPAHPAGRSPRRGIRRRQLDRGPRRRPSRRPRLVRQERQPPVAGRRKLVRARLDHHHGCVRTDARAGGRRLRRLHPLHRRVPDRGDHRSRGDRRQPLHQLDPAETRLDSGPVPSGDRRPNLRVRRLPGRLPDLRATRPSKHDRTRRGGRRLGRRDRTARRRRRLDRRPVRPLVRRRPGLPVGATQRPRRDRQRRRPNRFPHPGRARALPCPHRPDPRRTRRLGDRPPARTIADGRRP
jgi:hypothetical protein